MAKSIFAFGCILRKEGIFMMEMLAVIWLMNFFPKEKVLENSRKKEKT
jgi:hypothetical protein